MLDKEQKDQIRKKIETEIVKTEKNIEDYKEMTKPIEPDNAIGRVSRMDSIVNKGVSELALRKAQEKLAKLKFMLSQLDKDNFGICDKCKNPIPIQRILLRPQSRYCVNCAH